MRLSCATTFLNPRFLRRLLLLAALLLGLWCSWQFWLPPPLRVWGQFGTQCTAVNCDELSLEAVRSDLIQGCDASVNCGKVNGSRQITYKVYLKYTKLGHGGSAPSQLAYKSLKAHMGLSFVLSPSSFSHIDDVATKACFTANQGAQWGSPFLIFEASKQLVSIDFFKRNHQ